MNRLFVAYKPEWVSSNRFLGQLKRKYGVKKAGFSGTLDPFAKGVLIIAFGKYTRLFRFLKKAPKTYRATLWLGAESETLDIEKISHIKLLPPFCQSQIERVLESLVGKISYLPPRYSAKKIDGRRAYALAREAADIHLKEITTTIYNIHLLHYCHPFVTFETTLSEGGYVRSIGAIIAQKLGTVAALSMLERIREGAFVYEKEQPLDPLPYLDMPQNRYLGNPDDIALGKKIKREDFANQNEGIYLVQLPQHFAIIEIRDGLVKYLLNGVDYADFIKKKE